MLLLPMQLLHFACAERMERMQMEAATRLEASSLNDVDDGYDGNLSSQSKNSSLLDASLYEGSRPQVASQDAAMLVSARKHEAPQEKGGATANATTETQVLLAAVDNSTGPSSKIALVSLDSEGTPLCESNLVKVNTCSDCKGSCKACYITPKADKPDLAVLCVKKHFSSSCTGSNTWGHWTKKCNLPVRSQVLQSGGMGSGSSHMVMWLFFGVVFVALVAAAGILGRHFLQTEDVQESPPSQAPMPSPEQDDGSSFGLAPPSNPPWQGPGAPPGAPPSFPEQGYGPPPSYGQDYVPGPQGFGQDYGPGPQGYGPPPPAYGQQQW